MNNTTNKPIPGKYPCPKNLHHSEKVNGEYKNPIIENRIVGNETFATRLVNFLIRMNPSDGIAEEERDSLLYVATHLLDYQKQTATSEWEKKYLEQNKPIIS